MDVERVEPGAVEARCHLVLAVHALLAQDGEPRPRTSVDERCRHIGCGGVGERGRQARIAIVEQGVVFLTRADRVVAQALHRLAEFRPSAVQVDA